MSLTRDFTRASWRLKLTRAEHHLDQLEQGLALYLQRHPYRAERRLDRKGDRNRWRYVLVMPPSNDELAVILGDAVHNIRTALDHLAVAMVAKEHKRSAGFPVTHIDLWASDGRSEERESFERRIRHMPAEAQAIIKRLQPYHADPPATHGLYMLNSLENADKHRKLILAYIGVEDLVAHARVADSPDNLRLPPMTFEKGFAQDRALLFDAEIPDGYSPDSEMNVEIIGTPIISVDVGLKKQMANVIPTLKLGIAGMRAYVFPRLEPFVVD